MSEELEKNVRSFPSLDSVTDNDIFYTISKDIEDNDIDYNCSMNVLKKFMIGDSFILSHEIADDTKILLQNTENENKFCKYKDLEVRLFGENTNKLSMHDNLRLRTYKEDNTRGYITIEDVKNHIYSNDTVVESIGSDISNINLRLNISNEGINTLSKINIGLFRDWIYGSDVFTVVNNDDLINISSTTKRGVVSFDTLFKTIHPNRNIYLESEVNDNLRLYGTSTERGYIKLGTIHDYIENKLNIPVFDEIDDTVDEATRFLFFNTVEEVQTSGTASVDKLRSLILQDTAKEIEETTLIRVVGGIIPYSTIHDDIMNSVSDLFLIGEDQQQTDINDGDGIVFIRNEDETSSYNSISYLTLKEKIIDSDTNISISQLSDFDKIYIIGDNGQSGHILYRDLRDKIQQDLFNPEN